MDVTAPENRQTRVWSGCTLPRQTPDTGEMRKTPSAPARPTQQNLHAPGGRLPTAWLEPSEAASASSLRDGGGAGFAYQAGWLARALSISRPARHVDISASPTFAAIASAFVPVDYYEFEPLGLNLANLRTGTLEFDPLPFRTASVASLSTAGILEYLDSEEALSELQRVIAPDGSLLICLPLGRPDDLARAPRVYTFGKVLDAFEGFELEEFVLISDQLAGGGPLLNPDPAIAEQHDHGTGCFWLRKRLQTSN